MESPARSNSIVLRFLDSFLDEKNIKWLLGVGVIILLGSSIRLVSTHWVEYTPTWKYAILLGYTGAVYVSSQLIYFRMGLQRTGTFLMSLTVLLIPLTFFALHWVRTSDAWTLATLSKHLGMTALLGVNLALSTFAALNIFKHFLRTQQTTFVAAYMTLCLAGALVSALPAQWAPFTAMVLWAVFTIGVVKVNRHVFWMMEEERLPRVFGFFPVVLLAALFLGVFGVNLARHIELQWWGLGCVLISVPVLATANTVAGVFIQRTGNLLRPYPAHIIIPLISGVLLIAAGIGLTLSGLPRPYAMVPASFLGACALFQVAWRTRVSAFTWGALFCLLAGYQFSPLFFLDVARNLVQAGAAAVQEQKLPYAFYGLTYLPVLFGFTVAAWWFNRKKLTFLSAPLSTISTLLAIVLLIVSLSHVKATFPVCVAISSVFLLKTLLEKDWRPLIPMNVSLLGAATGFLSFRNAVSTPNFYFETEWLWILIFAAIQLAVSEILNAIGSKSTLSARKGLMTSAKIFQRFSFWTTFAVALLLLGHLYADRGKPKLLTETALTAGILIFQAFIRRSEGIAWITTLNLNAIFMLLAFRRSLSIATVDWFTLSMAVMLMQWLTGVIVTYVFRTNRVAVFGRPLLLVSTPILLLLAIFIAIPALAIGLPHYQSDSWSRLIFTSMMMVLWCYAAGIQTTQKGFIRIAFLATLFAMDAQVREFIGQENLGNQKIILWACLAIALYEFFMLVLTYFSKRSHQSRLAKTVSEALVPFSEVQYSTLCVLMTISVGTLFWSNWLVQLAGCISVGGLWLVTRNGNTQWIRNSIMPILNWQVIVATLIPFLPQSNHATLTAQALIDFQSPLLLAVVCSLSLLLWEVVRSLRQKSFSKTDFVHGGLLLTIAIAQIGRVTCSQHETLDMASCSLLIACHLFIATTFFLLAGRMQRKEVVWGGLLAVGQGVIQLHWLNLINIGHGAGLFVLLVIAALLCKIASIVRNSRRFSILSGPFQTVGFRLPLATFVIAVSYYFGWKNSDWSGLNSLAAFIAAAWYFWAGLTENRKLCWTISAAICNTSLALLWINLKWTDLQLFLIPVGMTTLFLVELLHKEIQPNLQRHYRIVGALCILASPTFEILGGSWVHMLTLMLTSVLMIVVSIGARMKTTMYCATAFLVADMIAVVVHGSMTNPNLLWIVGLVVGFSIIALAAYCEKYRESILSRIRLISADLESWK
ncbi:hypothetical protein SH668x_002425 [Planctomicrobium sp. SH668]|uniref:hypothetical protein n=1 Tax=Planctomicrobium sp. SH668 TaxID=3448126 RepID=UPI003F5C6237